MKTWTCSICGKDHDNLTSYTECVSKCYEKAKKEEAAKREAEAAKRAEEINAALNGVKQAKKYYEDKLNEFKEKYPKEYEINFGTCSCCKSDDDLEDYDWFAPLNEVYNNKPYKVVDIELGSDKNGKPVANATIDGKKISDEEFNSILKYIANPEVKFIADILGLDKAGVL